MSFLTDLFKGDFGNLGKDLSDAPSSLMHHPTEELELAGGAAALAAPFVLPELIGAGGAGAGLLGLGDTAAVGADVGADALGFAGDATAASSGQDAISALLAGGGDSAIPGSATSTLGSFGDVGVGGAGNAGINTAGLGGQNAFDLGGFNGLDPSIGADPASAGSGFGDLTPESGPGVGGKGAGGGGDQSFFSKLLGGGINQVTKNPLGVALAGGGLAYNMLNNKPNPNIGNLQGTANNLSAQGQQFMSYLQTGTLPPALQASVTQASNAAKARIIANHAQNGQSTDPTQNSALAQELAAADQNALIAVGQLGEQLFTAGQSEIGLSSQIYEKLIQIDQQQSAAMGKSIASFAAALGGGLKIT